MSFFSFSKINKESYSLVINIGSGSVSGGLVKFTEAPGEDVVYYAKETIPFQTEISVPRHQELMKSALAALAGKIRTEGLKKIDPKTSRQVVSRAFYVFSSPWSASQTKTIRVKEPKAFKVTAAYVDRLIAEQEKQFRTEMADAGRIIERKIIQVKINGYAVNDFYGKLARELEVSVFLTVVPESILQMIGEAVTKSFHIKEAWCHSYSLSVLSVINNLFPQMEDFLHIDVSEEITDISVIKDNVLASSVSIPLGRNDFMRELFKALNVTEEIADSMIKMHCAKAHDELAALKLSVAMDKAGLNWLGKITETLSGLKGKIYVPESIFLLAGNDLSGFLKGKLEKYDFKVLLIDNKRIRPPIPGNDLVFKLELMFLDNLYKI